LQACKEEEEGLHGVFKRRNGHQLIKEAANSSTVTVTHGRLNPPKIASGPLCVRWNGGYASITFFSTNAVLFCIRED
jgi:hypothetical protein